MRVLVVIPALNEEEALPAFLREVRQVSADGARFEALVVDDGSMDGTATVAEACGARILRLSRNLGIGGAVQAGLRLAHRERFDCAIQADGDGQHPPSEFGKLLEGFGQSPAPDLVIGSRYIGSGGFRSTPLRRFGGWWLRGLLRVTARLRSSDPTSGFRLYGPRALELFDRIYPYDYPEPEALAIAKAAGLRIAEVPVTMRERQGGQSSIAGFQAPYYMVKVTLAVVLSYLRSRKQARSWEK